MKNKISPLTIYGWGIKYSQNQTNRHTEALAEVSNKQNSNKRFFGHLLPQNDYSSALALNGTPLRSRPLFAQAQNDKRICPPELVSGFQANSSAIRF